ncbi:GntR family transcriptional regulator [Salipiger pallidus]|uniref:GntR family transcriptional regulator n=1 Tax=Salipiger pallidus TaxID=1775170 RepID=A0A8J3EIF8_9RHOB|nr:PLP-dependent aminotransferase family protein [Salipiger pallidus]GGG85030.1 GntR family transcriptional regulator [Salipiger pallidus]
MAQTKTDRIFEALETRILQGELPNGARLDSLRHACVQYGVSKNIMVTVYDRLVARGLVSSRQGAGFFVAHTPSMAEEPQNLQEAIDIVSLLRAQLDRPHNVLAGDGRPPENWLLNAVPSLTLPTGEGGYGTPHGLLALREYIAAAQLAQGIETSPSQIVTTFGANHALDLLIRRFVREGDAVLVDDPGYYPLFAKLRLAGAMVIGVPRRPCGPDPDALRSLARAHGARLFFTQSLGQNPTGCSIDLPTAHAILQVADRQDMLVVDDDPFLDLPGIEGTRLAHLDQFNRVIQIGSYSKTLTPSLRSGYVIARPDIASSIAELKMILSVSSSSYTERIIANLIRSRRYEKVKGTMARRLAVARTEAMQRLSALGLRLFAQPQGGLYGWLRLPEGLDDLEVAREASAQGIFLAPGSLFHADSANQPPSMRINWSRVNDSRFYSFMRGLS